MEKKIIKKVGYDLNLLKTDKFKTVVIDFRFKRNIEKEELVKRSLIGDILMESTENYPSKKEFSIAKEENYGQGISANCLNNGVQTILNLTTYFVNHKYTERKDPIDFLELFMDAVFNPDIDSSFKQEKFDLVRKELREYMVSEIENTSKYALIKALEAADKGETYTLNNYGYIEDLEKVTREELYEYYKDMIENDFLDISVVGDIDFDFYEEYFDKKIKRKDLIDNKNYEYIQTIKEEIKEVKEEHDSFQSKLVMILKTNNLTELEKNITSILYKTILGSGASSKLFTNVREKHSLCYSINASFAVLNNTIFIRAGINKKDYEDAKRLINIEYENMKNNITEDEFISAKNLYRTSLELSEESISKILYLHLDEKSIGLYSVEKLKEELEKITIEDIYSLAKKVKIDTIFLLEGGKE